MKKSTLGVIVAVVIIVVGIIIFGHSSSNAPSTDQLNNASGTPQVSAPVSEKTKVSGKTSKYQNSELGFVVDYPTSWEADNTDSGVAFIMPIDQSQVSTVAKLEADINVSPGKCAFPPITTIKDRGNMTVGKNTLDMISMSNTVQGRGYFNRMYSLQQGGVCYIFAFSSITQNPANKNLTGSSLTQANNNNKAIVNSSDAAFTEMVKSFAFVQGPAGQDETTVAPAK